MKVVKRDGHLEAFDFDKVVLRLAKLCKGLDRDRIDVSSITKKVSEGIYDGVTTVELDNLLAETAASMTTVHPDYSYVAARVAVSSLHKETKSDFSLVIADLYGYVNPITKKRQPMISDKLFEIVSNHKEELDSLIRHSHDFDYNYFGFKTLERSYLLRINGKVLERPQHLLMRVALGIHNDDIERVLETYHLMSKRYFTPGSPTLFNAGTVRPQLLSCFLVAMKDDSIEGIFDTLKECAMISKSAGGIGLHLHNIRSTGTYIAGSNGTSNGIIPMLRVFNNAARYVDQGGNKRPGAIAVYLEPWHADIFEFIDIRKNQGKEEIRARDLFPALWIPDLFMERVQNNGTWSLFSPNEAVGLLDVTGDEFKELYENYERMGIAKTQIKAQKLWYSILEAQTETGTPFMLYKDACNSKSNQRNLGVIKSSNLCCEIIEYSEPGETAVCNLASIALPAFIKKSHHGVKFDFKKLHKIAKVVTRNLNRVIDNNFYPIEGARTSNMRHRPIALGVQGLADVFLIARLPFGSDESKELNVQIFETIYHAAVELSAELAVEEGAYETFQGSPASKGLLQFDLWNVKPSSLWEWESLKEKIKETGLRNSLLVAPMPTASTSQILGYNECFEPFTSNIYTRRVLAGEFQVVNPYLLKDLIDLGLWNDDTKNHIIANNGSVQGLLNIPLEIRKLYRTVWEISQKTIIDMAADRSPFIDQSQSLNIHIREPTMAKLTSMHFYGWRKGLKTGMYYLRTQAASSAIQFTVDQVSAKRAILAISNTLTLDRPVYKRAKLDSLTPDNETPETTVSLASDDDTDTSTTSTLKEDSKPVGDIYSDTVIACAIENQESCDLCSG